jgi:hypothetical protein
MRRSVLPALAVALLAVAIILLLLPAQGEGTLGQKSAAEESGTPTAGAAVPARGTIHGLKTAEAKGLVQPVSDAKRAAAVEKVAAVAGRMLEQVQKERKAVGPPDKNPDKILVKMYMEVCVLRATPKPCRIVSCFEFDQDLAGCPTEQVPSLSEVFDDIRETDLGI